MKIEVRYQSFTGNTEKVANAVAKEAGVTAKKVSEPLQEECGILFLGGGIYAGGIGFSLKRFLKGLDVNKVKVIALFSTAASEKGIIKAVEKRIKDKNIIILPDELHLKSGDLDANPGAVAAFVNKALAAVK